MNEELEATWPSLSEIFTARRGGKLEGATEGTITRRNGKRRIYRMVLRNSIKLIKFAKDKMGGFAAKRGQL